MMLEDIFKLLMELRGHRPITPDERVRNFQTMIQSTKLGEEIELRGFIILRTPPYTPNDAIYYLLSPLSPSELKALGFESLRTYVVVKITENTVISGPLKSGSYVRATGWMDVYPWGNLKVIVAREVEIENYSRHWLEYRDLALSEREFERLFMDTIYADYNIEKAIVYSLFASPALIGTNRQWGEGISFSAMKPDLKIIFSVWEAFRYLHSLLPWELKLKKDKWMDYVDPFLDLDFRLYDPNNTGVRYYSPKSKTLLTKSLPVPKWAEKTYLLKNAVFMVPKGSKITPNDPVAYLSEAPFILTEPIAYERNPELERLIPNIVATIFLERAKIGTLNLMSEEVGLFRRKFESWLIKNRNEYGEKFDALRLSGMVFETNTRYLLSLNFLGAMARFNGKLKKRTMNDVLLMNQELLDLWMNEIPDEVLIRILEKYERYVTMDKRINIALSIFMDIEATSADGTVGYREFEGALIEYGFKSSDVKRIIETLVGEGYLYEPSAGRLRLIR